MTMRRNNLKDKTNTKAILRYDLTQRSAIRGGVQMYREAIKKISVLSPNASQQAVEKILSLEKHWVCPNNDYFFTVGAFSAREFFDKNGVVAPDRRDVYDFYHNIRTSINPVLSENFKDMYESIRAGLETALDTKVLYASDDIGLPGFQILGPSPQQKLMPQEVVDHLATLDGWSNFHVDTPYLPHTSFWQRFQTADLNNALTFTLSLQLPQSGSGLDVWKNPGDTEAGNQFNGTPSADAQKAITDYEFVPYQTGHLTYFTGHVIHRVAGRHRLLCDDRRITVQGHGVKCDDTWYLYN
jgi:hypothetical protein